MNERIKELARQAHFHSDQIWLDQDRFEKFAELIVRECASVAEARPIWVVVGKMIKEHFGVEE